MSYALSASASSSAQSQGESSTNSPVSLMLKELADEDGLSFIVGNTSFTYLHNLKPLPMGFASLYIGLEEGIDKSQAKLIYMGMKDETDLQFPTFFVKRSSKECVKTHSCRSGSTTANPVEEISILRWIPNEHLIYPLCDYTCDRYYYSVFPFIQNNLKEMLYNQDATINKNSIAVQFLSAVAFIHERYIAHLSIKPSNILIILGQDNNPKIKLTGFERAQKVDSTTCGVTIPFCSGDPTHMSPEQYAIIQVQQINGFQSDMWSCGTVLLYLYCRQKICKRYPIISDERFNAILNVSGISQTLLTWGFHQPLLVQSIEKTIQVNPENRISSALLLNEWQRQLTQYS